MSSLTQVLEKARGILFDMDGVLIDSEPIHEKAIVALTAELGDPLTDHATLYSFKGAPERDMAERLRKLYPSTTLTAEELVLRKIDLYADFFKEVTLIRGAKDFVEQSHAKGRRHGLTTSASRSTQRLTFETFGFSRYFEAIVTGEDISRGKPDPQPYLLTASKLGLDPKDCIVIEDSINGVKSGNAAGCTVIALTTTFPVAALQAAGAHFIIDGFDELK